MDMLFGCGHDLDMKKEDKGQHNFEELKIASPTVIDMIWKNY